jgi:hypothetical protein
MRSEARDVCRDCGDGDRAMGDGDGTVETTTTRGEAGEWRVSGAF